MVRGLGTGGAGVKEEDAGRGGFGVVMEEVRGGRAEELVEGTEALEDVLECTVVIGMWLFLDCMAETREVEMLLWTVGVWMLEATSVEICGCL